MKHRALFSLESHCCAVMVCVLLFLEHSSHAADSTWNVNAAGNWATGSNWTAGSPGSTSVFNNSDTATFGSVIATARTITVDSNRNLSGIDFSGNSFAYTLSGGSLLMTNGGSIQTSGAGTAHTDTISSPIAIQGDSASYSFTANSSTSGRLLAFTGAVSGASSAGNTTTLMLKGSNVGNNQITGIIGDGGGGGNVAIVKDDGGTWRLGGVNTFSGGLTIRSGSLIATTSSNALGTGSVTLGNSAGGSNNASLLANSATTHANAIVLASNTTGALTLGTTGTASAFTTTFSGGITGTNNLIIDNGANNGSITLSTGAINHSGSITHTGVGGSASINSAIGVDVTTIIQNSTASMLTLSGGNSGFLGTVQIRAGTLAANGSSTLGGAGATVLLGDSSGSASATLRLHQNVHYARPITVQAGSSGTLSLEFWNNTYQDGLITLNNNLTFKNPGNGDTHVAGGIVGTGNVIVSNATGATGSPIRFEGAAINNIGTITNNGTGIANTPITAQIGANVTRIIQNSSSSSLSLFGANTSFAGEVDVIAGGLNTSNDNALGIANIVHVGSAGTFNINNRNQTIAGLNDYAGTGGTVTNTGANVRTLTLGGAGSYNFSGAVTATTPINLTLTKAGSGVQTLTGANTYTGATAVNAGKLIVNGSLASASVTVAAAGSLGGSGTLAGTLAVSGTLAPGNSPGIITVDNNVTMNTGSTFDAELNGTTAGSLYDQLSIGGTGTLSLNGENNLQLSLGYSASPGDQFTIALVQGTAGTSGIFEKLNGVTTDLSQGALFTFGIYELAISYRAEGSLFDAGTGNNIMLQIVSVPEASTAGLLAGSAVLGLLSRRRHRTP